MKEGRLDRRDFLRRSAAATLGLGAFSLPGARIHATPRAAGDEPAVEGRRVLGRTGLKISDISFGSSRLRSEEDLVHYALARGINYFDTAEGYGNGAAEEVLGRALQGQREKVVLASKVKCQSTDRREDLMRALEGSLRRLRTDRIEVYFNHAVNDVERLRNPEWGEFVERAKEQGKIRFTGMSGHAGRLVECLDFALDEALFDVILVAYNFGQDPSLYQRLLARFDLIALAPELPRVLSKAHAKGVGVIAMKTLMGARLNDMRPYETEGATFSQAAFRWVLSNPNVDALVVSMKSREQIAEYLGASGAQRLGRGDLRLLERYAFRNGAAYCRPGCGHCRDACPEGVEIAEVLRTRMYAKDYEDLELARSDYAKLEGGASACARCAQRTCLGACPVGLHIPALAAQAHHLLARDGKA